MTSKLGVILFLYILMFSHQYIKGSDFTLINRGNSYIKNYSSRELDIQPQNWGITQDERGIIYVANHSNLLRFDGFNWKTVPIINEYVRSVAFDSNNNLYIGGNSEIGTLAADSSFSPVYKSLNYLLSQEHQNYTNVYRICVIDDGIFFGSTEYLFRLKNDSIKVWETPNSFSLTFSVNNKIFTRERGIGLKMVSGDNLDLVPDGHLFAQQGITAIFRWQNEKVLILSNNQGFYIFDGTSISPFPTPIDNLLSNSRVYHGINLDDGNFALATKQHGLLIISPEGELLSSINKENGLLGNNVKFVFQDREQNIWLALNNGISCIEYSSPFSVYNKRNGLEGIVLSLNCFKNQLFVGTTNGLFQLNLESNFNSYPKFERHEFTHDNVWAISVFNDEMIIGTNSGVFSIIKTNINQITTSRTYAIHQVMGNKKELLIGTANGLEKLVKRNNSWKSYPIYSDINDRITSIVLSGDSTIWLGTISKGIFSVKIPSLQNSSIIKKEYVTNYNESSGLPSGSKRVNRINNKIIISTHIGIFKFDFSANKFIPDSTFGSQFCDGSRGVFRIVEDKTNTVWIHSDNQNFVAKKIHGVYQVENKEFLRLEDQQVNVIFPSDDTILFGTQFSNVIQYKLNNNKSYTEDYYALISSVILNNDSLIYGGYQSSSENRYDIISYKNRNIRLEYAAPFFEEENRILFRHFLDGYDDEWSEWTKETKKDYTNLSEGDYIFYVEAKNIYGDISNIDKYKFTITPPYYRSTFAYILYVLLLIASLYLVYKWRIFRLEKEKENLKSIIIGKTEEVLQKNRILEEQASKLKELDKIKSRFFANISHEFRTPLTLIIGPVEQFFNDEKSEKKRKKLSMILRSSKKLLELINQLLDLSKLESGKLQLKYEKVDIVELSRRITSMFESMAERKNIKLGFYSEAEEIGLICDIDKIEKIITNLISNALKFTHPNGEVTIIISEDEQNDDFRSGNVKILVIDTGKGIASDKLDHVFEPFYQIDSEMNREFQGSGLGLSLVKEYVELHKGSIHVKSTKNKGTRFIIKLPLGTSHLDYNNKIEFEKNINIVESRNTGMDYYEEPVREIISALADPNIDDSTQNTILVVEDNKDVRTYIQQNLEDEYSIIEAENGEEGLATARQFIPDLILSDVMMPKVDGFQFCNNIKNDKNTSHIPVILLTAKAGDQSIMEGIGYGADDYIIKPFNMDILKTRIKNLIDLRNQLQNKFKRELLLQPSEVTVNSLDDQFLQKLHQLIEKNIDNPDFTIEQFCETFYISRTSLFRKIKALTGESPNQFLKSFRLKRAAQLLEKQTGTITEIAFSVGFNNSAYFSKCFREHFKKTPSEYLHN